jgi:mannitol-1-phosphate/altronate dehydrogenase
MRHQCDASQVVTTVPPVVGVDLEQYQFSLITRFSNVHIRDQVQRLAEDGSMKVSASSHFSPRNRERFTRRVAIASTTHMCMPREMWHGRVFSIHYDFL